jgi:protein TonB
VTLERRVGLAILLSLATHVAIVALAIAVMRSADGSRPFSSMATEANPVRLVWLNQRGPGGGGGGGGNGNTLPPRRVERPGHDERTVPAKARAIEASTRSATDPEPMQPLIVPVAALASGIETLPGAIDAPSAPPALSQGPGTNGGVGTGTGMGDGAGRGRGFGDGRDGGTGGNVYQPGGDVTNPIEIRKGTPQYTAEAMRARAQGAITIECVVQTTGMCTNIRVKRSFNPTFGLDAEAIKAAAQWRFRPGTRRGEPVPVLVTMEIDFALR